VPVDFFAKQGNRLASLEFDVLNEDGTAVNLTGVLSLTYRIWSTEPGTDALTPILATVTAPTPTNGHVIVSWATGDLAVAGRYYGRCDIVFSSSRPLTVPTIGYHQIMVGELGPVA
jgi:hypothetical protein